MTHRVEIPAATVRAPGGMVCSIDHLASAAGVAMLRAGGSAADAAIATSGVLAVTSQHLCGLGGDLFALVHHSADSAPAALNSSGRAGSGADPDRLRAEGHTVMPFRGHIASVPVPGCVDGWTTLHERFGRLDLADVLAPAIHYAENGFPVSPTLLASLPAVRELDDAADYRAAGALHVGKMVVRPGVARTLRAIVDGGRSAFYEGEFGAGLIDVGGGEFVAADLARRQAEWVEPVGAEAWGHQVWTMPPNSQGYLSVAGAWIAAGLDLPDDPDMPRWAHLLVEAAKQAGFDRPDVLYDGADGVALVAPERLAPRRDAIGETAAPVGAPASDGDTIYLCAVDSDRMGVSLIQSNASGWGSHLIEPSTRIFLHNRGLGFSLRPGHAAEYGPGRRPPHTLSPVVVASPDGTLRATVGTMGGDAQPQVVLQLLARLLAAGQSPGTALASGRWRLSTEDTSGFDTWADPQRLVVEVEGHAPDWDADLTVRGHDVRRVGAHSSAFGHAHLIEVTDDATLAGASDHRAVVGAAQGW